MPTNVRSLVFAPVGTGASTIRVRTENTVTLANGKWYKLEFDLKTSATADNMPLMFSTGTTWPTVLTANHKWSRTPSGTPSPTLWQITGLSSNPGVYGCYEQWGTATYYIKSDTSSPVYLHFQMVMKIGTDNYAVKLDNFEITRVDTATPTTSWTTITDTAPTFTDVDPVTTDWSDV
jgi:hypothetical protein